MSVLKSVTTGRVNAPPRLFGYGPPGIGKSTLAAGCPGVVFLPTEDGLSQVDCAKLPLVKTTQEVIASLEALYREEHPYTAVAIDTVDWLDRIITDEVCAAAGVNTLADVGGGWGKGTQAVLRQWRYFVEWFSALHAGRGMTVILLAHAKVETFSDPEGPAYDRYSPRLQKDAVALLTEWTDAVLFATTRKRVETKKGDYGKERTVAHPLGADGGERILRCIGGPACIAKNRYNFPAEMPLSWPAIAAGIAAAQS